MGAGQPRNSGAGGAPTTKVAPGAIHPIVAGHSNASTAVRPVVPITAPQTHAQLQAASPQLNNCLRYSAQQAGSQPRSAMQMGKCSPGLLHCTATHVLPLECSPLDCACPHSFPAPFCHSPVKVEFVRWWWSMFSLLVIFMGFYWSLGTTLCLSDCSVATAEIDCSVYKYLYNLSEWKQALCILRRFTVLSPVGLIKKKKILPLLQSK